MHSGVYAYRDRRDRRASSAGCGSPGSAPRPAQNGMTLLHVHPRPSEAGRRAGPKDPRGPRRPRPGRVRQPGRDGRGAGPRASSEARAPGPRRPRFRAGIPVTAIASVHNPRVAAAVALHEAELRDQQRRFLVEGRQTVLEALASAAPLVDLFVGPQLDRPGALLDEARARGVPVRQASAGGARAPDLDRHPPGSGRACASTWTGPLADRSRRGGPRGRPGRGPGSGQRRDDPAVRRRVRRGRRGVLGGLGGPLQPEDGPGLRRLALPSADRPRWPTPEDVAKDARSRGRILVAAEARAERSVYDDGPDRRRSPWCSATRRTVSVPRCAPSSTAWSACPSDGPSRSTWPPRPPWSCSRRPASAPPASPGGLIGPVDHGPRPTSAPARPPLSPVPDRWRVVGTLGHHDRPPDARDAPSPSSTTSSNAGRPCRGGALDLGALESRRGDRARAQVAAGRRPAVPRGVRDEDRRAVGRRMNEVREGAPGRGRRASRGAGGRTTRRRCSRPTGSTSRCRAAGPGPGRSIR